MASSAESLDCLSPAQLVIQCCTQVFVLVDKFDLFSFDYERIKCWGTPPEINHHLFGLTDVQAQEVVVTPADEVLHSSPAGIFIPYNHSCQRRIIGVFHLKGAFVITSTVRSVTSEQCWRQHTPEVRPCSSELRQTGTTTWRLRSTLAEVCWSGSYRSTQ